jgi:PTS system arbutin-like IIC component
MVYMLSLAATLSATLYFFGLSGNFGGGLIDCFVQNWIPLFPYHAGTYIMQICIGLCFTAIYFFVFRWLILRNDYKTPGRTDDDEEDKLFSKAEYKAKKEMESAGLGNNPQALKAKVFLDCLGGPQNIKEVTNCATRLRVTVADPDKVAASGKFTKGWCIWSGKEWPCCSGYRWSLGSAGSRSFRCAAAW